MVVTGMELRRGWGWGGPGRFRAVVVKGRRSRLNGERKASPVGSL
jgi:hypothetical protein